MLEAGDQNDNAGRYLALCDGGLEHVLAEEIEEALPQSHPECRVGYGQVLFRADGVDTYNVQQLKCAHCVYAFVDAYPNCSKTKAALAEVEAKLEKSSGWRSAVEILRRWNPGLPAVPSFRATGVRQSMVERHEFTSLDAAQAAGAAAGRAHPDWGIEMKNFDIEVMIWVIEETVMVGLTLLYSKNKLYLGGDNIVCGAMGLRTFHFNPQQGLVEEKRNRQEPPLTEPAPPAESTGAAGPTYSVMWHHMRSYRCMLVRTALKPSTAHALLRLAGIHRLPPGSLVVDPAAGCGTIALEAAQAFPCVSLGGDKDNLAIEAAETNCRYLNATPASVRGACDILKWSVRALPLRAGVVDCVVSDLPFGVHCKVREKRVNLYDWVAKEAARVLRPTTGCAVLLGRGKDTPERIVAASEGCLIVDNRLAVNMAGLPLEVLVLRRTPSSWVERAVSTDGAPALQS